MLNKSFSRFCQFNRIRMSLIVLLIIGFVCVWTVSGAPQQPQFKRENKVALPRFPGQKWQVSWHNTRETRESRISSVIEESKKRSLIIGFYHISTVGYYEDIVKEQLHILTHNPDEPQMGRGMWDHIDYLFVGIFSNSPKTYNCGPIVTSKCLVESLFFRSSGKIFSP